MKSLKKLLCLMLAAVMAVSLSVTEYDTEKVYAASETQIYNESDWNKFAESINGGEAKASAVIMSDFTATSDFVCAMEKFSGTLDGNGHTITGLDKPLFDYVSGGTIKNLRLADIAITEYIGYESMSAIADSLYAGTISNCIIESGYIDVGGEAVGAIAGIIGNNGTVSDCVNNANVSGTVNVGGITGTIYQGTVKNCANKGDVKASDTGAGGIAGNMQSEEEDISVIENSYNQGNIYAGTEYAGGIAGSMLAMTSTVKVMNVYNTGDVNGGSKIGGITGDAGAQSDGDVLDIANAYSTGSVSGKKSLGTVIGRIEPGSSFKLNNIAYAKDESVNSSLYSVGTIFSGNKDHSQTADYAGTTAYAAADFASGKAAYALNAAENFDGSWSYWSYDGKSVLPADDNNARTYKVTYMNGGKEYKTVYSLNTGLYEVQDMPEAVDGSLFAGWYLNDYGTLTEVTEDVQASAADFSSAVKSDVVLYPVYLSVGTLERDPADKSSAITASDNSGFYLEGAQIRKPDASKKVTAGVRFITRISTALISNVEQLNDRNQSLRPDSSDDKGIGYGTVVTAKKNVASGSMIEKDENAASVMNGMIVSPAVINYREYNGYVLYTALVVGIPESHYTTDIAARPYITYYDANGVERTYYYTETSSSHNIGGGYYSSYKTLADFYG